MLYGIGWGMDDYVKCWSNMIMWNILTLLII